MSTTAMSVKQNTKRTMTATQSGNKVAIYNQLDKPEVKNNLVRLFGTEKKANRFIAEARINLSVNPELAECSPESFVRAAFQTAQLNLSINPLLGQAWLISRWNSKKGCKEVNFQAGYKGYLTLCRRAKEVLFVDGELVYENDSFYHSYTEKVEVQDGLTFVIQPLEHEPCDGEKGNLRGAYAKAIVKNGDVIIKTHVYMTTKQLELFRDKYASTRDKETKEIIGQWVKDFDAMALKTVLGKMAKKLPLEPNEQAQLELQEEYREPEDVSEFIEAEIKEEVNAVDVFPEPPPQLEKNEDLLI